MLYANLTVCPARGGLRKNIIDVTITNTADSPDAGSEDSKIGNYNVLIREYEHLDIDKQFTLRIEGFPRKEFGAAELLYLVLHQYIVPARRESLLKRMKKGLSSVVKKKVDKEKRKDFRLRSARQQ